ncbi:hypothetical protein D031_0693B, partial [Vibrio parahaemolyticus VP-48]
PAPLLAELKSNASELMIC